MWKVEESSALEICDRFSSMSLSKLSPPSGYHGEEEHLLRIHDLHSDYVRRMAGKTSTKWHRRNENAFKADNDDRHLKLPAADWARPREQTSTADRNDSDDEPTVLMPEHTGCVSNCAPKCVMM